MTSPGYVAHKETSKRWSILSPAGNIVASFLTHEQIIHPQVLAMAHAHSLNEMIRQTCERAGISVDELFENLLAIEREQT